MQESVQKLSNLSEFSLLRFFIVLIQKWDQTAPQIICTTLTDTAKNKSHQKSVILAEQLQNSAEISSIGTNRVKKNETYHQGKAMNCPGKQTFPKI